MLMLDIKDRGWWYWLASSICLWLAVTIQPTAYYWALLIAIVQLVDYIFAEGGINRFPVQVRMGYLSVLLMAMPEGYHWVLWVPAVGTALRVLTGYCIMARTLMLMPFNRQIRISWHFIKNAFLAAPERGNVLHGLPAIK